MCPKVTTVPTPRELLAELLKQARLDAGYASHAALAKRLTISRPQVSKAESPTQPVPSDPLLAAWAGVTGASLDKIQDLATRARSGTPDWFVPYKQAEAEATMLRCWGPLVIPGVAQIEPYAREVISADGYPPKQLDDLVTARLERQSVLQRAYVVIILAAGVLTTRMDCPQTMADQCAHLAGLAELPNVTVHVVPPDTNHGAYGAVDIASRDGLVTVNFSTATDDVTTTATDRAERAIRTFERILGHAMPVAASLDHIREIEGQWKSQTA